MTSRHTRSATLAALLASSTIFTSIAHAQMSVGRPPDEGAPGQVTELITPPRLEPPGKHNMIIALGVTVVSIALCVGMVVLPGRRNFED